jgi:tRNA 2-thiouridine synthesizing protein A
MIEMEVENERVERLRLQRFGEDWIEAITVGEPERLEGLCLPDITSSLLTPKRFVTLDKAVDLAAKYHEWFGECTNFQVEASRVGRVGERLGIFYRFLLRRHGDWYTIEQQVYCTLKGGRVERLHLLCSGFQLIGTSDAATPVAAPGAGERDPVRDELLEFRTEASDASSTCALLTPAIKARLREMRSAQVLEVRVDDPSARGDIEAWSRLSGNTLVKVIDEGRVLRFFVKKK